MSQQIKFIKQADNYWIHRLTINSSNNDINDPRPIFLIANNKLSISLGLDKKNSKYTDFDNIDDVSLIDNSTGGSNETFSTFDELSVRLSELSYSGFDVPVTLDGNSPNPTTPQTSEYVFSQFQASLIDGADIDSGWIDMASFDKYQFEGRSADPNMTLIISSSRIDGGGEADDVVSTTEIATTFHLFNVICRQRYIRIQWKNNTGVAIANCSCAIKVFRGASDKLSVFPLSLSPTSFSQAALNQSILIGQDSDGIYETALINKGSALVTADFFSEVAQGNIPNFSMGNKFGRNPDIDTGSTPEDLWNGGGLYTGQPANYTPETVEVFSSEAVDTSAGNGARTIRIFGLKSDTSEEFESEDIILNGTTPVTSVNTWWRLFRAYTLTAGSLGYNEGEITVRASTTTTNVFIVMPATLNQTTIGAITVPANKTMIVKRLGASITRTSGAAGSAFVTLRIRTVGGVFRAIRAFEMQTGARIEYTVVGGEIIPAGTDLKATIESVSDNNTVAEGQLEYVLINMTS